MNERDGEGVIRGASCQTSGDSPHNLLTLIYIFTGLKDERLLVIKKKAISLHKRHVEQGWASHTTRDLAVF